MAIDELDNGRFKVTVDLGGRGKHRRRAVRHTDTREKAERLERNLKRRPADGHHRTVLDAVDRYLDLYGRHKAAQTYNRHLSVRKVHVAGSWLGDVELDRIDADDLERFYAELFERGLATNTVRKVHGLLSVAFAKAVRPAKWMAENPCRDVEIDGPPPAPSAADEYDLADVARVLDAARRPRPAGRGAHPKAYDHAGAARELDELTHLAIGTGARAGELAGVRWSDVELSTGVVSLHGSISKSRRDDEAAPTWVRKSTKTGRPRRIVVDDACRAMLEARYRRQVEQAATVGLDADQLDGRAVLSRELEMGFTSPAALSARWARAAKAAGVELTFHGLRHINASEMANGGVPVPIATARTGHGQRMFFDTYGHHRANIDDVAVPVLAQTWATIDAARRTPSM